MFWTISLLQNYSVYKKSLLTYAIQFHNHAIMLLNLIVETV